MSLKTRVILGIALISCVAVFAAVRIPSNDVHLEKIVFVGLAAALGALSLFVAFSLTITQPIDKLIEYAQKNRGDERFPLPRLGPSEFRKLGEAFEEMRLSLEGRKAIESYVQTLTHEIKSPLTAIRGAAELCQEEMSENDRQRFLGNIRTEAERIQKIIEALLDIAALESRKGLIEATTLDLNSIIEEVIISLEPVFIKKGVRLSYRPSEENLSFQGESFLMTQSIRNLIQNAIDFSSEGDTIEIKTQRKSDEVAVSIADEGPGIPDYAESRIFEKFYSLGRPKTGKKSSGLGLSFVKEVALLHHGKVEIRNRPPGERGAIAVLSLPA